MSRSWFILLAVVLVSMGVGMLICRTVREGRTADATVGIAGDVIPGEVIRLGIIPERDIFAQRRRYRKLADYLETKLHRPIELVTVNTYRAILDEFAEENIDAAFLGSMVAKVAMARFDARVLLKPQLAGQVSTYHGVIFVPSDSPIQSVADLKGATVAYVRTTTAGDLFGAYALHNAGLLGQPDSPKLLAVGTHDEVILDVVDGTADAGAVKNLRLDAWESVTEQRMRRIAEGPDVPNNALVLRRETADDLGPTLAAVMLTMHASDEGRAALAAFGAERFVPCEPEEYAAIDAMAQTLHGVWQYPER